VLGGFDSWPIVVLGLVGDLQPHVDPTLWFIRPLWVK
jgi:hypothetical protein